jgi:hypothetical protein
MLFLRRRRGVLHTHDDDHDDMGGLHRDAAAVETAVGTAIGRGDFLRYSLGAGALALFGCGGSLGDITSRTPRTDTGTTSGTGGTCSKVPEETAGPFPGDGSDGGVQRRPRPRAGDCDGRHSGRIDRSIDCRRLKSRELGWESATPILWRYLVVAVS